VAPLARELFLVGAGALAGLVGTAGGITSLVSYPALLLAGIAPLQANVANIVALVACWPGSALASRPELAGRGAWLRRWGVVAALGGTAGSVLLLVTPAGVFGRVVPFLVVTGSLALLAQPRIAGVLVLALLLLTTEPGLVSANALKNMVVGAATITSAILFAVFAHVDWSAVAPLAAGTFLGSLVGPRVARRLPPGLLRWLVALTGLVLTVRLWLDPAG